MTLTLERRGDLPNNDVVIVARGFSNCRNIPLPAARKQLLDLEVHDMGACRLCVGRSYDLVEQRKMVMVHFEIVGSAWRPCTGLVSNCSRQCLLL